MGLNDGGRDEIGTASALKISSKSSSKEFVAIVRVAWRRVGRLHECAISVSVQRIRGSIFNGIYAIYKDISFHIHIYKIGIVFITFRGRLQIWLGVRNVTSRRHGSLKKIIINASSEKGGWVSCARLLFVAVLLQ